MKTSIKSSVAALLLLATFNLGAVSARAATDSAAPASRSAMAAPAPRVVSSKTPLTSAELAKYQQRAAAAASVANDKAAGASENKTVLIVVGVVVVAGVIALAAGGGGGGGGY